MSDALLPLVLEERLLLFEARYVREILGTVTMTPSLTRACDCPAYSRTDTGRLTPGPVCAPGLERDEGLPTSTHRHFAARARDRRDPGRRGPRDRPARPPGTSKPPTFGQDPTTRAKHVWANGRPSSSTCRDWSATACRRPADRLLYRWTTAPSPICCSSRVPRTAHSCRRVAKITAIEEGEAAAWLDPERLGLSAGRKAKPHACSG